MTNDELTERLRWMQRMQEELEAGVLSLESRLYRGLLLRADRLGRTASALNDVFTGWLDEGHHDLLSSYSHDLFSLAAKNNEYYQRLLAEEGAQRLSPKVVREAERIFLDRFGIDTDGNFIDEGYIDQLISHPEIKLKVTGYVIQARAAHASPNKFIDGLDELINGQGIVRNFYQDHVVETYQLADRMLQQGYADALGYTAFIYAGGTISSTREFCREKNGKVFLTSEALLWEKLPKWRGRVEPYNALLDLGGVNCRHSKNYISNRMAMERREDLEEVNGQLVIKMAA